jgi:NADH:ubiquinone oxidoreductase subunit D
MAVPQLLEGIRLEDLPVVLASLDLGIAEADR